MSLAEKVTLGCDPEFFIQSISTGKFVPSCGLIGGEKGKPVALGTEGASMHEDNVTVELNIPPSDSGSQFRARLTQAFSDLQKHLSGINRDFQLTPVPAATFELADLEKHPSALMFGCDPDFMGYSKGEERKPPSAEKMAGLRMAGGHIHIGYPTDAPDIPPPWAMAMLADLVYARWMKYDPQGKRRKFYGQAGLFRPKSYGVEYRTPSNFWTNPAFDLDIFAEHLITFMRCVICNPRKIKDEIFGKIPWDIIQGHINSEKGPSAWNVASAWYSAIMNLGNDMPISKPVIPPRPYSRARATRVILPEGGIGVPATIRVGDTALNAPAHE